MYGNKIDEMKFEYEETFLPNVLVEWTKPDPDERPREGRMTDDKWPIEYDDTMKKLLTVLATKHPSWKFVFYNRGFSTTTKWIKDDKGEDIRYKYFKLEHVAVFEGKECLGSIRKTYGRNSNDSYLIENERINDIRERGRGATTKDMKKAIRLVEKMFGAKTHDELLKEVREECTNILYSVASDRKRKYEDVFSRATKGMKKYIIENWQTLSSVALQNGADPKAVESLLDVRNESLLAGAMYKCKQNENGSVVLIHGNDYVVQSKFDGEETQTRIYSQADVPEDIKRGIGMLKLVDVKFYIQNVGVRIADNAFFISTTQEMSDE